MQIRFSTKSFGRDAAAVAAKAIGNVAGSLTDADISDIIAGELHLHVLDHHVQRGSPESKRACHDHLTMKITIS
jgi:hypothetical protein